MSSIIKIKNLTFSYSAEEERKTLDNVNLEIEAGQWVALIGHNGSGKSTLARCIDGLLMPESGSIEVDGLHLTEETVWDVRERIGMVFQNPDNQIIGTVVEEDVGFGPENMGVPTKEIWERVYESLNIVGMYEYRKKSPNKLSGGQKQRVSIAGVLAMHPKCIILDEPTAMLDPVGRKEVIRAVRALNDVEKITVILITHYMEEAIYADRIYVMDKGSIVLEGEPHEVFEQVDRLEQLSLSVPEATKMAHELRRKGVPLKEGIISEDELVSELMKIL